MKQSLTPASAFTLVELLVTMGILAVLAVVSSAAYHSVMGKAGSVAETAAAKSLASAYQAAAADNGGKFLPALDSTATNVVNGQGRAVSMKQARSRYPFRLAPYFGYDLENTLLVGKNKSQILKEMGGLVQPGSAMYDYAVSAFPALGINRHFVGGTAGVPDPNNECIRTTAQADRNIIVFASAGSSSIDGYEYVRAPGAPGSQWAGAEWKDGADPGNYGYVHPRHNGKAVAAFLDGSVRLLSLDELRDMRLWSRNAAIQDNPDYKATN
jgi:prepilin-type N-terminal cleavage/methylation domain-containing protein/prepilin-type processing-associated H-X9-DG protein